MLKNEIFAFGLKINPDNVAEIVLHVDNCIKTNSEPLIISGVNVHSIILSYKNSNYRSYLRNSNIVNIDGFGVLMALKILGHSVNNRSSCPDLFHNLLKLAVKNHYSVFFLGSSLITVEKAVINLKNKYIGLNIAGFDSGYFNEEKKMNIIKMLKNKRPQMLFLGMPSPMKEDFSFKYKEELQIPVILGVGGLFDIEAGFIRRAPTWCQKIGMEWFYRLIQEPQRLWRRYLLENFEFILITFKEKVNHIKTKNR